MTVQHSHNGVYVRDDVYQADRRTRDTEYHALREDIAELRQAISTKASAAQVEDIKGTLTFFTRTLVGQILTMVVAGGVGASFLIRSL